MESMRSKRNTSQEDIDERDIAVSFDADFTDMPSDSGSMEVKSFR
uniref:Uncharacterized protein n=1 Tax=Parascaris equorum TaxID=6256 RepID=A0A914RCI8_PAREQ